MDNTPEDGLDKATGTIIHLPLNKSGIADYPDTKNIVAFNGKVFKGKSRQPHLFINAEIGKAIAASLQCAQS